MTVFSEPQYAIDDKVPYANDSLTLRVIANDTFILWPGQASRAVSVYKLMLDPERAPVPRAMFEVWMTDVPDLGTRFFTAAKSRHIPDLSTLKINLGGHLIKRNSDGSRVRMGEIAVYSKPDCKIQCQAILIHTDLRGNEAFYEGYARNGFTP